MSRKSGRKSMLELEETEHINFGVNLADLEESIEVFDALYDLFDQLRPLLLKPLEQLEDIRIFMHATNLYQLMKQDFLKGMLSLVRGYITDATFHTRRLLEAAAVMKEIISKPRKVPTYANLNDDDSIKKYVDDFKIFYLTKTHLSSHSQLHYDSLCLTVHPSAIAVGSRAEFTDGGHVLHLFDVETAADLPWLKQQILIFLLMSFEALKGLQLPETNIAFNIQKWNRLCKEFDGIFRLHSKHLKEIGVIKPRSDDTNLDTSSSPE